MMKTESSGKYDEREERGRFITANLPLVYAAAKRFLGRGTDYEELCQAGALGLIRAYDGYNKKAGIPFPAYAFKFIEGEIRNALRKSCCVHISRLARETAAGISAFIEEYEIKNACMPDTVEISAALGIEKNELCAVMNAFTGGISLDSEQGEAVSASLKSSENTENSAVSQTLIRKILASLPQQEANVFVLRYDRDMTQLETAEILNCSQSKVSKLEKSALYKIRAALGIDK